MSEKKYENIEYKIELLIPRPMGIGNGDRGVRLEGTIKGDPQIAHATYHLLNSQLSNLYCGEIEHTITIYKNGQEITKQELSADFKDYCGLK